MDKPSNPQPADPVRPAEARPVAPKPALVVGVGASAGGLEAFTQLLQHLPVDTGMSFVLVQHLDPARESALAGILAKATAMPVHEVTDELRVKANQVYIIPPNTSMGIAAGVLQLHPRPETRGAHRTIDAFFEALAQDQHGQAIGVILSGTASDGTLGLEAIKAEGGITFAQDASAAYDSMPRSAIASGCVDFVLSPPDIAGELARIARHPCLVAGPPPEAGVAAAPAADNLEAGDSAGLARRARAEAQAQAGPGAGEEFRKVLLLLRNHSGVDFSLYKTSTIQRRITRRMVLNRLENLPAYAQFLRGNAQELDALYSDVLISVTSFFRNPKAFAALQRQVFSKLLAQQSEEPIRAWVAGCSTGQEAYSLVMAFLECSEPAGGAPRLQVFGTDLNEKLLEKARAGLYPKAVVQDVAPERLRRFFVEEEQGYRISKPLREMVVFARQNLLADPPFSRLDLISCRNLLIYVEPALQQKLLPLFHYALKPEGVLFLGASESIGSFTDLFEPVENKHKLYRKRPGPTPGLHLRFAPRHPAMKTPNSTPEPAGPPEALSAEFDPQREADRLTLNRYAPPGVLVNAEGQILQFRGDTSPYLKPPTGKASFGLLNMAREELLFPLRSALNRARQKGQVAREEGVRVNQNGHTRTVNIVVAPLKNLKERCYVIYFEAVAEHPIPGAPSHPPSPEGGLAASPPAEATVPREAEAAQRRVAELERELAETRDYLQAVQEQNEAANEELQASNEEVTSANEELQSINEELETSKEELESSNEELTTLNEEMGHRNAELNRLNSDLLNIQTSADVSMVLVGRDLAIRRFSSQAAKGFNLVATDEGRSLASVRHNLDCPDLEQLVAEVIATVGVRERELRDQEGRWYSLRVRPYLTIDNRIDGAVLVLVDIDALKRTEREIREAGHFIAAIVEAVPPLLILDEALRVERANASFYEQFKVSPAQTEQRPVYDLGNGQWDIAGLRTLLEEVLPRNGVVKDFEVSHDFESIGPRTMLLHARRLDSQHRILLCIQDITKRKQAEAALAQAKAELEQKVTERTAKLQETIGELEHFSYSITHDMRAPLRALQGFAQLMLEEGCADCANRISKDYLGRIMTAANRMDALIRDALQYSQAVRTEYALRPVAVKPLLRGMLETYPNLQPPHAEVFLEGEFPPVLGNEAALTQCFSNLLENAVKFVASGTLPQVRVWAEQVRSAECGMRNEKGGAGEMANAECRMPNGKREARSDHPPSTPQPSTPSGRVRIWFEDNGIGIAKEYQQRIFDMFQQLDKDYEGTGIGLALVRKNAERMGGKVGVESAVGQGSRFWLELQKS